VVQLDESQLEAWVEAYTDRLVRLAYTYVRDWALAEDRVQDAFLKAYCQYHQFQPGKDPFPWLARITINECKMSWRRTWREVVTEIFPPRMSKSAEIITMEKLDAALCYQFVLDLVEPFRTPIILYYFEDLSIEQISDILSVSKGTVKSRLARGREKLYRTMVKEGSHGKAVEKCETSI
jgi:RNA polymerase sigma-70 factor (ECF subfamily)